MESGAGLAVGGGLPRPGRGPDGCLPILRGGRRHRRARARRLVPFRSSRRTPALALHAVRSLPSPRRRAGRDPQQEAGVLPGAHRSDRSHRRRRGLAAGAHGLQPVRLRHVHLDPGDPPDGMGRHVLPMGAGAVLRHHGPAERHLLDRGACQSRGPTLRRRSDERRRAARGDPPREAGIAEGRGSAVARDRHGGGSVTDRLVGPPERAAYTRASRETPRR